MSDADWRTLLVGFRDGFIDTRTFHDRFFDLWHACSAADWISPPPAAIEALFYVVEAYSPDPDLRRPDCPWEADEQEPRSAVESALVELAQNSNP